MYSELANSRTEVLAFSERLESRSRRVKTPERQAISAPVDFNTLPLQGEEYDRGGKCNCA